MDTTQDTPTITGATFEELRRLMEDKTSQDFGFPLPGLTPAGKRVR